MDVGQANHLAKNAQTAVLLVDDDAISRRTLQKFLERDHFQVFSADGVDSAITILNSSERGRIECVVTDYRMPEKDGLCLLAWMVEHNPEIGAIMVTAEGEKQLVAESLRQGACDFLEKPVDRKVLGQAVRKAAERIRTARARVRAQQDMRAVGAVQQQMIGMAIPDCRVKVDLSYHPSHEAGGDHLALFQLGNDRFLVLSTDVSGHDLRAAYLSVFFQGFVRGMMHAETSIEDILVIFNRYLVSDVNSISKSGEITSVAVSALLLDLQIGMASTLSCGFPLPYLSDGSGNARLAGESGSPPLGWFEDTVNHPADHELGEKSRFYIWTDGLDDLAQHLDLSPLSCAFALLRHRKGTPPPGWMRHAKDDILVASVGHRSVISAAGEFLPLVSNKHPGTDWARVDALQAYWARSLQTALPELDESRLYDVLLCTREIMLNALIHGCGKSPDQSATVDISCDPAGCVVRVVIQDTGAGHDFDWSAHKKKAEESLVDEHRGLMLIDALASRFETKAHGTRVEMDFVFSHSDRALAS
ncbi:MAG: response regulator [Verrucomicrobia bacterium]|nr:response regulator [Verrucomicrobiota bacterium]